MCHEGQLRVWEGAGKPRQCVIGLSLLKETTITHNYADDIGRPILSDIPNLEHYYFNPQSNFALPFNRPREVLQM